MDLARLDNDEGCGVLPMLWGAKHCPVYFRITMPPPKPPDTLTKIDAEQALRATGLQG